MTTTNKPALTEGPVLHNGVKMPWLGLGVYKTKDGEEVVNAVKTAISLGYRSIDTAAFYNNEKGVGQAIRESGVPRNELFITTKVWNSDQGYESTLQAFEKSRKNLGLDVIDLYLVHWPVSGKFKETWKALVHLYQEGAVKAIGVSNHRIQDLQTLIDDSGVVPAVNQVELHPVLTQKELLQYCKQQGIQMEAWSPLMQGHLNNPTSAEGNSIKDEGKSVDSLLLPTLAGRYHKTIAQIVLRWHIQNGVVVIPKSVHENRILENSQIFDFELHDKDMEKIDALNMTKRFGPDPDNIKF